MATIDDNTGRGLLRLARKAVKAEISGDRLDVGREGPWPPLERHGVFVTLRKSCRLRGCIGTFTPRNDLPETVKEMAEAATRDPRFVDTPISAAELKDIRIELSILSPLERISDPTSFELGRHGLYLKHGLATGCFLPDVGTEQGWDKETFLSELCRQKAGLSPVAWRDEQAEIYVFTVRKFSDEK